MASENDKGPDGCSLVFGAAAASTLWFVVIMATVDYQWKWGIKDGKKIMEQQLVKEGYGRYIPGSIGEPQFTVETKLRSTDKQEEK